MAGRQKEAGTGQGLAEYLRHAAGARAVTEAFDMPTGLTPREVVWALNKARLYRYAPVVPPEQRLPVPLLLVYALINKPYIFDLRPGRSFIEFMLERGFDVYLLDWGSPGAEDRRTGFDDYAVEYLPRAVRKLLRLTGAREISLLGYCLGATLVTLYAAYALESPVRNLVLLTAPLDFTEEGLLGRWLAERNFDLDRFVGGLGNVPAGMIDLGAMLLKPVENTVATYLNLWERLEDERAVENWQAMYKWVHDGVPLAGEAFRQWVQEYIRGNKLIRGELRVRGRRIDLGAIGVPLLNVIAAYDHIVPNAQSTSIMQKVSSRDKELMVIEAGHVGIMAGKGARQNLWPRMANWLETRST